jgi:hypothetical protein
MFYVNPTLSLLGYRIYRASKGNDGNAIEIIILTKDRLTDGNMVSYIELDDNIYYGKRRNKNDKE